MSHGAAASSSAHLPGLRTIRRRVFFAPSQGQPCEGFRMPATITVVPRWACLAEAVGVEINDP